MAHKSTATISQQKSINIIILVKGHTQNVNSRRNKKQLSYTCDVLRDLVPFVPHSSMCAFYIFKIVQMVPDCAKHKYVFLFLRLFAFEYATEIVIQT